MRALFALLCAAGPGLACPEPDDLASGITLTSDLQTTVYRALSPEVVESRLATSDHAATVVTTLAYGLLPMETRADFTDPAIPDQHTLYSLDPETLAPFAPPADGQTLTLVTRVNDLLTGRSEEVTITLSAGREGQIRIGECPLRARSVTAEFERPGHLYRAEVVYLLDLGFSFVARRVFDDGREETITPLSISAT